MKHGPDIAYIASLIGDPARANILTALLGGLSLTASELAVEAGVTKQTCSSHLARLQEASLIAVETQGRHRYHRLADSGVAALLENLMGVAAARRPSRVRPGPKEPALRQARVCYDHLAGDLGVALFDALVRDGVLAVERSQPRLTVRGEAEMLDFGIDLAALGKLRRPLCRSCLDWSARRSHLAGALGAALLQRLFDVGWARRVEGTRVVDFTPPGRQALKKRFALSV
ncbi:ArsR/SmtB family transcription factor [Algihabitans albus]|uniref:ArsR/SmtB family transcription factor n=1 Tax=Algihabitans albus TaxID=2164067 RepID=UPI000E5C7629|nr:winged helix-turn-helix domain-containing protein [Algihabitans albus]